MAAAMCRVYVNFMTVSRAQMQSMQRFSRANASKLPHFVSIHNVCDGENLMLERSCYVTLLVCSIVPAVTIDSVPPGAELFFIS